MMSLFTALVPDLVSIFKSGKVSDAEARKRADELAAKWASSEENIAIAQAEIAKLEATGNWYQRSWRPTVGWVCALAFGWHFLAQPVVATILAATGVKADLPDLDIMPLLTVLGGMLGLGGMRTIEKLVGKAK